MIFYKRFIGDFQRDTKHLSLLEKGVYNELLDHYYATMKALPTDPPSLYRIAGAATNEERAAVDRIVEEFFPRNGSCYHNKRADKEIESWKRQSATNRRIAKERSTKR